MKSFSLKEEELDALITRVESGCLKAGDADIIKAMVDAVKSLSQAVNDKATSIKKLLKMIFGSKTEKKKSPSKNEKSGATTQKEKKKGHGKRSADEFTGADKVAIAHDTLSHKDPCPLCPQWDSLPSEKAGSCNPLYRACTDQCHSL